MCVCEHVSMAVVSVAATFVFLYAAIDNGAMADEPNKGDSGKGKDLGRSEYLPETAFEYAKMVESELGVPPKVDIGKGVEIPIYVDGVKKRDQLGRNCDNPTLLGPDITRSGSDTKAGRLTVHLCQM